MDGNGSATITDLTVELVTNRERYEETYPSESDSSDSDEDPIDLDTQSERARNFTAESQRIHGSIRDVTEDRDSAQQCLEMLSTYGEDIATRMGKDLHEQLIAYRRARKDAYDIRTASERKLNDLNDEHAKLLQDNKHVAKDVKRQRRAVTKAKHRLLMKQKLAKEAKLMAKHRLREERSQFWPRKVFQVVLTLETNWDLTPKSSRRGSIDSLVKPAVQSVPRDSPSTITPGSPLVQHRGQISLSLSYSTLAASWSPRYDLSLSTPGRSGAITYHAEFFNQTSESWRDAKVILSTSQTTFQSLSEPIPTLPPWQIRLSKSGTSTTGDEALVSRHELAFKHKGSDSAVKNSKESRLALFGAEGNSVPNGVATAFKPIFNEEPDQYNPQYQRKFQAQQQQIQQQQIQQQLFQQQLAQQAVQQAAQRQPQAQYHQLAQHHQLTQRHQLTPPQQQQQQQQMQPSIFTSLGVPQIQPQGMSVGSGSALPGSQHIDLDAETTTPDDLNMSFEESTWEETGLTATYDVPGLRTIPPSNTTRRHKIASVVLQDVRLSYILVPKLREAAFLQARLQNSSSITLLRGPAGLTLDGSFLGNITIPRCSAGQPFSLNLGVDPAVRVGYQKPTVHHRQSGIFQKEGSSVYTRAITVTNTKNNAPIEGVVLDQVPVSEDERLRVEIYQPKGLRIEGDRVACGTMLEGISGDGGGGGNKIGARKVEGVGTRAQETTRTTRGRPLRDEQSSKSSEAIAVLKKGGEVCWEFKLGMGKTMKLALEYETRYPSGEKIG